MLLREVYELAVRVGIEADPRGAGEVQKSLERVRQKYEKLPEEEKGQWDQEQLENPYSDTRILLGDRSREIKRVLAGIDIDSGEILMADRLRERGQTIDLVLAHHPQGSALAAMHKVMHMQEDILHDLGIPINVAEGLLAGRIAEVERSLMPINHNRAVDAARILDFTFMCVHTPADNLVNQFLERKFSEKKVDTVGDVLKAIKEIPEYAEAARNQAGPRIIVGAEDRRAGKIFVDMTGGTSGAEEAYQKMAQAGVGTIVGMHMGDKHRQEAEKNHINVIIAGHMSSDSLGLNLFLDELERKEMVVIPCSGLHRVKR
ncbi:MAG: NGG1p interacting factor NIF3 [Bacillota bacterium]